MTAQDIYERNLSGQVKEHDFSPSIVFPLTQSTDICAGMKRSHLESGC